MIKVNIIALSKLKEKYLQDASNEYIKRLSRYCDLKITELSPALLPEKPSKSQIDSALQLESQMIEKVIPKGSFVISLCIEGKELSSEELSEKITSLQNEGKEICFIIGSSYGLSQKLKDKSNLRLSMSKMTFPHQLFRILLLEQVYRSFKICEGSTYHK